MCAIWFASGHKVVMTAVHEQNQRWISPVTTWILLEWLDRPWLALMVGQQCVSERTALSFSQHQQNEKFLTESLQITSQHLFSDDVCKEDEGQSDPPHTWQRFDV